VIRSTSYKGKKVAVFGLGLTGISAALSLASGGADVFAWDDNDASVIL
jgi:UDP-N-acetylmuramoylalanine--D-glutamate ligase